MVDVPQGVAVKNLDGKRVCDISNDRQLIIIGRGNCRTLIKANNDGTLCITQTRNPHPKVY